MSDTHELLSKIAAVRERLEKARGQGPAPGNPEKNELPLLSALVASLPAFEEPQPIRNLQESVHRAGRHGVLLDGALADLAGPAGQDREPPRLPRQLTPRAHRILEQGRELLTRLRAIDLELGSSEENFLDDVDPLADWHRDTVAMVDAALHIIPAFLDVPSAQQRLCEGLEVILRAVAERVELLARALEKRRQEISRVDALADLLTCLEAGRTIDLKPFADLAETIVREAREGAGIRFHYPFDIQCPRNDTADSDSWIAGKSPLDMHWVARFVACHSLIVAQVMARMIQRATEWRGRDTEPVLSALIHDVGMLRVPAEILTQRGALTVEQKSIIADHCRIGTEIVGRLPDCPAWLVEAVGGHHERLDGTGYPAGVKEAGPLTRLLAVGDIYAALCAPRPHRPTRECRAALTDVLLLAEQGALDRNQAEGLLFSLSFYPVGSVVELADGSVGLVLAGPTTQHGLDAPARPVITSLTDSRGRSLPQPQFLDLARGEGRSIVRSLSSTERRRLLGKHYPELV
jgi:HD-GYP domain-containing protein (c-di-GMP phosphodiesterase class II)